MPTPDPDLLGETYLLGLGNVLVGDDGAGLAALAALVRRYAVPPEVALLDGGVLGLHLLGLVGQARRLLVLDAVRTGRSPGELVRLEGDRLQAAFASRISAHELGFSELLAAARLTGQAPRHLVVLGVEPGPVEEGIGLSAAVAAAVDPLADAAAAQLQAWGIPVTIRDEMLAPRPYPDDVLGIGRGG